MDIKLRDGIEEQIVHAIAGGVEERVTERIDEAVRGAIKGALEKRTRELVDAAIGPVIEQVLAEGWQPTDQWGDPVPGKARVTLHQRVSQCVRDYLDARESYNRQTKVEKLIDEAITTELRGEAGKALEAAKAKIREQVDAVLQAKLRDTLATALGIPTAR